VSRIARLWQLPARQRRVVAKALVALPLVRVALAVAGVNRTYRLLAWVSPVRPAHRSVRFGKLGETGGAEMVSLALATARLVRAAAIHGRSGATCLPRALVTWAILRGEGVSSDVRIGARCRDGKFEAHAWIEAAGAEIDLDAGDAVDPFVPFDAEGLLVGLTPVRKP
jgi:hypothetical protein